MTKKKELWIQDLEPGTFRAYLYRRFGKKAFTERGTIKREYINRIKREYKQGKVRLETYRRAVAAETLKELPKPKKRSKKKSKKRR